MPWTPNQIEAMENENMIHAVLEMEEVMQGSARKKTFVPHIPEDGEERDPEVDHEQE